MEDLIIYVASISGIDYSGIDDIRIDENLYVGMDYNKAIEVLKNYDISNGSYYGRIAYWKNGEEINADSIIIK